MASTNKKHHGVNANASGTRVGYATANAEHMKRVDELLANFVNDTQGWLISPSTVSWRRGNKGAKLDHVITWNLPPDSSAGSLGASWRNVGTEIPARCKELDHPELAQCLARTMTLGQHELQPLLPQGLTAQSVVRVGEQVFRPVPLGQVDWLGGPQHDHARVGFRICATGASAHPHVLPAGGRTNTHPPERLAKIGTSSAEGAGRCGGGNFGRSPGRNRRRKRSGARHVTEQESASSELEDTDHLVPGTTSAPTCA
jgi:hypothetical protein